MKTSEYLKSAHRLMSSAPSRCHFYGICFYIHKAGAPTDSPANQLIEKSLSRYGWAHNWLYGELNGLTVRQFLRGDYKKKTKWFEENQEAIYQWRLDWLQSMIKQFEAQGD